MARDAATVHRDLLETNLLMAYRMIADLTAQLEAARPVPDRPPTEAPPPARDHRINAQIATRLETWD